MGLEGQMAIVGEGTETAEGAIVAIVLCTLDRWGIEQTMSGYAV